MLHRRDGRAKLLTSGALISCALVLFGVYRTRNPSEILVGATRASYSTNLAAPGDDVEGCANIKQTIPRQMGVTKLQDRPPARLCSKTRMGPPRYTMAEILQQIYDWKLQPWMPPCNPSDVGFRNFNADLSVGAAGHPLQATCEEMQAFLHANGFAALIAELADMEVIVYDSHALAQFITVDALNAGFSARYINQAFRHAKNEGLCWGPLLSGGIEHGMQWSITGIEMGARNKSWADLTNNLGVLDMRASSQFQIFHGVGHGATWLYYTQVKPALPMEACTKGVGDIDTAGATFSNAFCMTAPNDRYRAECINGLHHEVFHHPSPKTLQDNHWAHFCLICPLPIACWDYLIFGGVSHIELYKALEAYPTVIDTCFSSGFAEDQMRGCTFGVSTTMYPIYRAMLLSGNFDPDGSLEYLDQLCNSLDFEAHKMKVKLNGVYKYCGLLTGTRGAFPKLVSSSRPLGPPFVEWCRNFVPNTNETSMDDVDWRRLSACVRGSVHFTTDVTVEEHYGDYRFYTHEGEGWTDYCADLKHAPPSWRPEELQKICYRTISWDFQQKETTWSALMDQ